MSRAAAYWFTMAWYSLLAALVGTGCPEVLQMGFDTLAFSPKSVRAMILRVFWVLPVLLVTHISTLPIFTPVVRLGSVFMAASYLSWKYWERKKWRFSS